MLKIFASELRHTWLGLTILPITAYWLWLTLSLTEMWKGAWVGATTYATSPAAYAVLALCTVVGYESARRHRTGLWTYARFSPRAAVAPIAIRLAATLLLAFVPFFFTLTVVWAINQSIASPGGFDPGYLINAALVLAGAVTLAELVGLITTVPFIGAIIGGAIGVITGFFTNLPVSIAPDLAMSPTWLRVAFVIAVIALIASLLLPALAIRTSAPRVRRGLAAGATALVVGTLGAVTIANGSIAESQVARARPDQPACSDSTPQVCVWPDHAAYLKDLTPFARKAAEVGEGVFDVPEAFNQFGLYNNDLTYTFKVVAHGPGLWWSAADMGNVMMNSAIVPGYCEAATDQAAQRRGELMADLSLWLERRIYRGGQPEEIQGGRAQSALVDAVLKRDDAAQKEWAASTLQEIRDTPCAPNEQQ